MVIWLRNPDALRDGMGHGVGITDDVVRAEHFGALVEIDSAYEDLNRRCAVVLEEARTQAQAILDAAQAQADELVAQAQATYEGSARMGYEAGWEQGLADWHERSLRMLADMPSIGQRQRDRLAQLVALAVEQIVATADPIALFRQAASTVECIVADGSPVKVRVHPHDLAAATAAFGAVAREWREVGRVVNLQVSSDAQLERGYCICETDLGAVDASLPQQLAAIRDALSRAIDGLPPDEDEPEPAMQNEDDIEQLERGGDQDFVAAQDTTEDEYARTASHTEPLAAQQSEAGNPADPEEQNFFADAVAAVEHTHAPTADIGAEFETAERDVA
ncbi:type III secretion system stator protein SctL [Paraburkholderia megapolitana]|uniref:type III secretion system stator protein SctL n=1 Tax=Paraburkholderia megapolitana TaxID=420953 RepID=UPI0038B8BD28